MFKFIQKIESKLNIFVIVCAATTQKSDLKDDYISKFSIELREFNNTFLNN